MPLHESSLWKNVRVEDVKVLTPWALVGVISQFQDNDVLKTYLTTAFRGYNKAYLNYELLKILIGDMYLYRIRINDSFHVNFMHGKISVDHVHSSATVRRDSFLLYSVSKYIDLFDRLTQTESIERTNWIGLEPRVM